LVFQYKLTTAIIGLLLTVTLSGCGGGGGGSTAVNPVIVANAGPDQLVSGAATDITTITLSGTTNDNSGTIVSHQWTQIQNGADVVTLNGAETPTATFSVNGNTEAYLFNYTVTGNEGLQSTDTVSVYTAEIVYSDPFDNNFNNWSSVDDTGNGTNWIVSNGKLYQTINTVVVNNLNASFVSNTSYHLGTYARLDNPNISGGYRFSVDITPIPDSLDVLKSSDIGIMFGYVNSNNYYRVSMNARYGFTRFERRSGGIFQTLAVNSRGYVENQAITLTAEINGNAIIVWIDGDPDPVFAHVDSSPLSGTVALYCQERASFDNVIITENPLQPLVAIATPLAHSIALTQDDGTTLSTTSVVLNVPSGGDLLLRLDGSEITATPVGNIYTREFLNVADGEHEFAATLRYADGTIAKADINGTVGTGGQYYVTVGDSITNGVGDKDPSNNDSFDGRIVAVQGYQAPLYNSLWTQTQPVIVFNEGITGDRASDLDSSIASILDRHPKASQVLLMIGTNDSGGSGLDPNAFENVVTSIATQIAVDGKQVWLAEILPINDEDPTSTRNTLLKQYNTKIRGVASQSGSDSIFLGPDFFNAFANNPQLYTDALHPNDAGYGVMADRWIPELP